MRLFANANYDFIGNRRRWYLLSAILLFISIGGFIARGGFNLGTFANLMKGSQAGIVVNPGKGDGSRLIDVLDSGDMRLVRADTMHDAVEAIQTWVDDPQAPLPTCEEQS